MKKLPVFLALDVNERDQALALAEKTHEHVLGYKIGPRLLFSPSVRSQKNFLSELKSPRASDSSQTSPPNQPPPKIFLDFKFFDIPTSTLEAVKAAYRLGADYATVHAAAGAEALKALREWQTELEASPGSRIFKILFVTALTSEPASAKTREKVFDLARLVIEHGFDGLVCSPREAAALRKQHPRAFLVSPGIRSEGESPGDQKRVMTAQKALAAGSSALVMGRSLIQAKNISAALRQMAESIKAADF